MLSLEEAATVLCYPRPQAGECGERIRQLRSLGVEAVLDTGGSTRVSSIGVLGKGWSSIVVLAVWDGRLAAVKVRRLDSRRVSLIWEAVALATTSHYMISPRLYAATRDVIVMEYVRGPVLGDYEPSSCWQAWLVLRRLLVKAWLLDRIGILHNELARPHGQVIVRNSDSEPFIIDFESSTPRRRGSRRTNLAQLIGGLRRLWWVPRAMPGLTSGKLRQALKAYKERGPCIEVFEEVLASLGEPAERNCMPASSSGSTRS